MTLIVEDGTGVQNAESYISVTDADAYHANRGALSWTLLNTTEKEQALRRATDFMLGRFRSRWKGARVSMRQGLDWPRQGVMTDDMSGSAAPPYYAYLVSYQIVPVEVARACAELALRAAAGPLLADESPRVTQETIGPITIKYDTNSPNHIKYSQVDEMLAVYLGRGGNSAMVKLTRS